MATTTTTKTKPDPSPAPAAEATPLIYAKMTAVMRDVGAVGKNNRVSHGQSYDFRGIDDVMAALQPVLVRHGVLVIPTVLDRTSTEFKTSKGSMMQHTILHVRYDFFAEDGSSVSATVVGEGADVGDKSCNKAMSGALKYCLTHGFCIPTEERKDSEWDRSDMSGGRMATLTLGEVIERLEAAETWTAFRKLDPFIRNLKQEERDKLKPHWKELEARFQANGAEPVTS